MGKKILADANIFIAVILNEEEKNSIIQKTAGMELLSPVILPYEVGNALSAMAKRKRLNMQQIARCFEYFKQIPVSYLDVNIYNALEISYKHNIYAYDAYYLEAAKRMKINLMTLDKKMISIADILKIPILEF